jgi:hypothetical protein
VIEPLTIGVTRVPAGSGMEHGSTLVVGSAEQEASTAELFERFSRKSSGCRAGQRTVAIISAGVFDSPDQVTATGSRRDRTGFDLNLEVRDFDGPLAANDQWLALVRMELGYPEEGSYQLTVHETVLRFTDIGRPETAEKARTAEWCFHFSCLGA